MTEYLINRPARLTTCPTCNQPTLAAISGGLTISADPKPLTINQEIAALLTNRPTYDILTHGFPKRIYLEWRSTTRIKNKHRHTVVAEHPCRTATYTQGTGTDLIIPSPRTPLPDDPPF